MRDPMSWSIPLFRAFGIQVKLHILYIVITLGLLLRQYAVDKTQLTDVVLIWVVMLFCIILLHEFGHCFAARKMDGEADEILMWPLGGLAYCAVPHTPKANFVTAIGGPMVNVFICLVAGAGLFAANYYPPVNIFEQRQLYSPDLRNWQTGDSGRPNETAPYYRDLKTGERFPSYDVTRTEIGEGQQVGQLHAKNSQGKLVPVEYAKDAVYPTWVLWTARLFWLSWALLLFNLIPAFPLDGGRILQCILWGRSGDYRAATQVACWSGLIAALLFLLYSFWQNETLLLFLGLFIMFSSYQQLMTLDHSGEESGPFGYDFSKGYGGFGPDDDTPAKKAKRHGPVKRWLLTRRARKMQREVAQRHADESRLDELLDKISRNGKESLSAEEKRFMDRVSERYRNR